MAESSPKRRTSIGVLFWIAFILLVLVIFLANRSNIEQVLESTGLVEVMRDRFGPDVDAPAGGDDAPPAQEPADDDEDGEPLVVIGEPEAAPSDPGRVEEEDPTAPADSPADDGADSRRTAPESEPDPPVAKEPADPTEVEPQRPTGSAQREPSPDPARPNRLMAGLYFIRVTEDGRTFPQRVVRPVYYSSSPLTQTIRTLIDGPSSRDLDDGLLNLIPEGTQLISAHVTDGVAVLNFNQSFRFNPLGAEGTVAQLLQVIYSSTEFPTVERVQFLVEGERVDYLGGDGIYVGEPLGRDAFSS